MYEQPERSALCERVWGAASTVLGHLLITISMASATSNHCSDVETLASSRFNIETFGSSKALPCIAALERKVYEAKWLGNSNGFEQPCKCGLSRQMLLCTDRSVGKRNIVMHPLASIRQTSKVDASTVTNTTAWNTRLNFVVVLVCGNRGRYMCVWRRAD